MVIKKKAFIKAIELSGGNQSIIAKKLKKSRAAITQYLHKHPDMKQLVEIEAERIIDVAENVIDSDISNKKSVDSAKWKLLNSKRGKARGYGPKQENVHTGGLDNHLQVEVIETTQSEDDESEDDESVQTDR